MKTMNEAIKTAKKLLAIPDWERWDTEVRDCIGGLLAELEKDEQLTTLQTKCGDYEKALEDIFAGSAASDRKRDWRIAYKALSKHKEQP